MDAEARKVKLWADTGDRIDPSDSLRVTGFVDEHSEPGSGFPTPDYEVWNQILREFTGWVVCWRTTGFPKWDININYQHPSFVTYNGVLYVTIQDSSGSVPSTGHREWKEY